MTKNEFKAWFDGFCEGMEGAPNEKQWERIKARVAEINDVATPYPVFVDRYVTPYRRYWDNVPYWNDRSTFSAFVKASDAAGFPASMSVFMRDAGRVEYLSAMNSRNAV